MALIVCSWWWLRRWRRTGEDIELRECLTDEFDLASIGGEVAVTQGGLGELEVSIGVGDEAGDVRRDARSGRR